MKKFGRFLVSSLLLTLSVTVLGSLADAQPGCQKQQIGALAENVEGNGFVCPEPNGVNARLVANGLTPGDVYTVWIIYIDDPAKCTADGEAKCFGENNPNDVPDAAFGRLADVVAPENGQATLSGKVPGLQLSAGSQAWLLLKGHGPAASGDNLALARQLLTPEDPTVGAPNLGIVGGAVADFAGLAIFSF